MAHSKEKRGRGESREKGGGEEGGELS